MRRLAFLLALLGSLIALAAFAPPAGGSWVRKWDDRTLVSARRPTAYWSKLGRNHPAARRHWHQTLQWALNARPKAPAASAPPVPAFPWGRNAPPWPAGVPTDFQGASRDRDFFIDVHTALGGCGLTVRALGGAPVGAYVDDTAADQAGCVAALADAGFNGPRGVLIAGISMGQPNLSFPRATWSAYEWYPHCHGLNDAFGIRWSLPARDAYIVQWNFSWTYDRNHPDKTCTPPSAADHAQTWTDLAASNQIVPIALVLYY